MRSANSMGIRNQYMVAAGQIYSFWTVKEKVNDSRYWICVCICTKEKKVRQDHLKKGLSKSCGCKAGELNSLKTKGRKSKTLKPDNFSAKRLLYSRYKKEALQRNLEFSLTENFFFDIIQNNCFYCDAEPTQRVTTGRFSNVIYNGIDRVRNNLGYYIDNVVACCKKCNTAKSNYSDIEFLSWVSRVYNFTIRNNL